MDAMKGQKKRGGRAAKALKYFKALYQVETLARLKCPPARRATTTGTGVEQQHCVPLLDAFKVWLDELAPQMLPDSLLGKAIAYTRNCGDT